MSTILLVVLSAIFLFVFVSLVLLLIGPILLLQPQRRTVEFYKKITTLLHPSDVGMPCEEFVLKSAEGIPISCWFIKVTGPSRGTIIYLHGVSECKIAGLPMARMLHEHGYHVFLYDSRRHGDSGGKYCTYGFYEKHDATTVINHLMGRGDMNAGKIGLFGASMGAAVALQVAAHDTRVTAVVAESGFATLRTIFDDYQRRMIKLPWHYLRNMIIKRSEHLAHFRANDVSPLDAVKTIGIPLLIMHGTADNLISYKYSEQVFQNANEPKELWLIQGARHSDMMDVGGAGYIRVIQFFDKALGRK